jgi:hypothetical protein
MAGTGAGSIQTRKGNDAPLIDELERSRKIQKYKTIGTSQITAMETSI